MTSHRSPTPWSSRLLSAAVPALATWTGTALAQQTAAPAPQPQEQRLEKVEQENAELRRRLDLLAEEIHASTAIVPPLGERLPGLGQAASKVYGSQPGGVSIGGYGEAIYQDFDSDKDDGSSSGKSDEADLTRAVLYVGYKFDEDWLFNSEIEVEHADEVFAEFAYLDWLGSDELNARAGLLLAPMGFLNELHEPTTFPSAKRPGIETAILPTTWRENGAGIHGELGEFTYRTYLMNGLRAAGFTSSGLRGGRQKGSQAVAEDFAWTGRVDYTGAPGVLAGASAWIGDSGQDLSGVDVPTAIVDLHAQVEWRGWRLRALWARAELDDVDDLNAALGFAGMQSVGERLEGIYAELGYDVLSALRPGGRQSLTPFVRWETYDTQADVPSGFSSDPARDIEVLTLGVAWQPIDHVVFKLDWMDVDDEAGTGVDQFNVALGYVF